MNTLKALRSLSRFPPSSWTRIIRDWAHQKMTNVYGRPQTMDAAWRAFRDALGAGLL